MQGKTISVNVSELKEAIREVIDEKKEFFVAPEEHYQDHQFMKKVKGWFDMIEDTAINTAVKTAVRTTLGIFVLGLAFIIYKWSK